MKGGGGRSNYTLLQVVIPWAPSGEKERKRLSPRLGYLLLLERRDALKLRGEAISSTLLRSVVAS